MRTINQLSIVALLILLVMGLTGCSETGPTGTDQVAVDDYETMDLDKAFGGLTATDESADFGDDYYATAAVEDLETETEDPLQDDLEVQLYEQQTLGEDDPVDGRPRPVITVVRMTWGQLGGEPENIVETDEVMDWSGLFQVDRGIVVARRLILFEKPRDHVVRPRIDRQTLAYVSHTGPHFDGLILEIIEPPVDPDGERDEDPAAPNMMHLRTPQLNLDLNVADLAGMDETYAVDDMGNALRLEGLHLSDLDLCPKGFLSGIWIDEDVVLEDGTVIEGGFFKGRWMGLWGRLQGLMRGRYGVNEAGEPVFFGKYISRNGQFKGLIEGTYTAMDENGHGTFSGQWVNRVGTVEGVLGGGYLQIEDRPGGFYSGRWATLCDEDAETID